MGKLGRGKLYFDGTGQDIEDITRKLRDKLLPVFLRKIENKKDPYERKFRVNRWLRWIIEDRIGGSIRYCDPLASAFSETYCERHGLITIYEKDNILVHSSAVTTEMYDNFTMATALGFYFLNWDTEEKDVLFGWQDDEIAWQARRFAASLLLPKKEVFECLQDKLKFNPNMLNKNNYEWYARNYTSIMAGFFEVTSKPVGIRLRFLFEEFVKTKEEVEINFSTA